MLFKKRFAIKTIGSSIYNYRGGLAFLLFPLVIADFARSKKSAMNKISHMKLVAPLHFMWKKRKTFRYAGYIF